MDILSIKCMGISYLSPLIKFYDEISKFVSSYEEFMFNFHRLLEFIFRCIWV